MNAPVLSVDNVKKTFGDVTAVDGASFAAKEGTVLALLGPNGAGKTTTIEMCEGFTRPTSGTITVLGENPATHPQRVRDRIGIMLQGGGSYSGVKVREMLKLSASYNANPHDPEWLMALLGLEGVANTTYRRLSGGQKQRLSLALALIGRPELVFLDEPTAGMDAQSRNAVWDIVSALKRDGTTIVLTTHLMDEAESLADDIVIMDHGKVVAEGSPADLTSGSFEQQITFGTAQPLDLEKLKQHVALCQIDTAVAQVRPMRYVVNGSVSPELVACITEEALRQSVLIRDMQVSHMALEEVFLNITGKELRS
ncbi:MULTISPECIES: ABC transporter ATP-binding protein [Corynebacterium]|uniref:ABC transporter ATP-binding protein n=1 Tax=Corynebacterium pseudogenitalium TaxID=38303 RepID=A0ABD4TR20_9CORY|nr:MULTISPECIES: ABC transporter ATP-binding protein [Corynebacterium]MCQ4609161.1 ABC transporter ATP-binding protein [Corynebacterium sp. CCUG 61414]MCQ4611256.1 ABC transporter ATP-binding protein [Corynebacterium sp. CCUG 51687]MCQ4613226.1 ABC transporter ATP-binding protein [Corynebacterium pseudogenitalium]MDK8243893.1 ABC transporter ATP-binding protein [Corynebacterium sp. UMB10321]MDK8363206.1 ABC transporter ATP-binding protein [Corynebacterium sp. UMB10119B]